MKSAILIGMITYLERRSMRNAFFRIVIVSVCIGLFLPVITCKESVTSHETPPQIEPVEGIRITVLYDNYVYEPGTRADWGFSCLIQETESTILFDTGTDGDILFYNISQLGVDIQEVDLIVISHKQGDRG